MQVSIEVVAGIVGLVVLGFSFALMLKQDKIHHLRELMRLRMTEGGKVRVTIEEQLAIESVLKAPVSDMGSKDYLKASATLTRPPAKPLSEIMEGPNRGHDYEGMPLKSA